MTDDTPLPFDLPAVRRKKLTVDFDGGNQSSDARVVAFVGHEVPAHFIKRFDRQHC
jgi:hypothetical protein